MPDNDDSPTEPTKAEVVPFAYAANNNRFWTVEQMLERVLHEVRTGQAIPAKRAVVVLLNDENGNYTTALYGANISASQCVALLQVRAAKAASQLLGD